MEQLMLCVICINIWIYIRIQRKGHLIKIIHWSLENLIKMHTPGFTGTIQIFVIVILSYAYHLCLWKRNHKWVSRDGKSSSIVFMQANFKQELSRRFYGLFLSSATFKYSLKNLRFKIECLYLSLPFTNSAFKLLMYN